MINNTKLLVVACILVITSGLGFLWFGLNEASFTYRSSPTPFVTVVPIATSSATQGVEGEKAYVVKVVDGDTIEITGGQSIRLIGIDTPETVDPRRPVGCFGKEASNETKKLLTGREVILQKDVSDTDKYKRLLRYIYLPLDQGQILFVNDYLVREGFARVMTYPPDVKFNDQFRMAEQVAKAKKLGLWGKCN